MKPNYYKQIKSGQKEREWKLVEQQVKKKDARKKGGIYLRGQSELIKDGSTINLQGAMIRGESRE